MLNLYRFTEHSRYDPEDRTTNDLDADLDFAPKIHQVEPRSVEVATEEHSMPMEPVLGDAKKKKKRKDKLYQAELEI